MKSAEARDAMVAAVKEYFEANRVFMEIPEVRLTGDEVLVPLHNPDAQWSYLESLHIACAMETPVKSEDDEISWVTAKPIGRKGSNLVLPAGSRM
jgi:hypothetical protein